MTDEAKQAERNIVILAPHVDDEVIGCWRLLESGRVRAVAYFAEVNDVRGIEAQNCAKKYGFTPIYLYSNLHSPTADVRAQISEQIRLSDVVYAPNCRDHHPMHKWVNNRLAKYLSPTVPVRYYSTDMNVKKDVLGQHDFAQKMQALYDLFPSQSSLFQNDAKYALFESDLADDRTTSIEVTFRFEGIHCYPLAPMAVAYLQHPHRHVFHVTAELQVWHDDRDVEFIMFKHELEGLVKDGNMNHKSCEMIAKDYLNYIVRKYPDRNCKVKVSEDGENAATVEYKLWD